MTKQEFVAEVANRSQLTARDAGKAVDAVLETITDTLKSGGEVAFTESPAGRSATDEVDDRESLLPMLRTLPSGQRAVLVLRYLCDLPDAEIAATLRVSTVTVRSQASRGLATLRATHRPSLIREVS